MSADPTPGAVTQPAPPEISPDAAAAIAREHWGIVATARTLGSHQDRNFLLESDDGPRLLLKVANPSVSAAELEAQSAAAALLSERAGCRAPRARAFPDGTTALRLEIDGVVMHARVLEFLEGATLSGHLSRPVVEEMGSLAARTALALSDLDAPEAERVHQWDLRHARAVLDELLPFVADPALRERLADVAASAWSAVEEVAAELPVQFIHGDLTDDNVVTGDPVTRIPDGVIDLGDLNRTWTVGELAITVSSLLHHDGVDLAHALRAVTAYDRVRPLTDAEAAVLWPLLVVRAATLVASAHHVLETDPGNDYAAGNLDHELAILDAATAVPLEVARALVAVATGRAADPLPLPPGQPLLPWLAGEDVAVADFSPTSPVLHEGRWLEDSVEADVMSGCLGSARVAVARFGEARLTRSRLHDPEEPCNVALGVELRVDGPQPVAAPWAGTVATTPHGVLLRSGEIDLVLGGVRSALRDGSVVDAGELVGEVEGTLWVQVLKAGVQAPRFVPRSLAAAWRAVVADAGELVPGHPDSPQEPRAEQLLARREAVYADVQEHYFPEPPVMVRGWREHLVDADGRVYLDTLNNVTSIGHAHPRLVAAVAEQWSLLNTNSRFHYASVVEFSERLAELVPDPLDTVFLVNSGSEAVDLALRLGQAWSGRTDVLSVEEAYHGWTYLSDAVSTSVADNPAALETRPAWVHTVPAPHPLRGRHRDEPGRYAADAVAEIERLAAAGSAPGAFIAETLFGNGGGVALPEGYLAAVYGAVRAHGGLAIADEVQVGYGRLGEWFWGFEQQGVVPDVVAVAKAMDNGHPLGAVITTREIAERYRAGGYFFSSAGGSPVSSVVGLTVLDVIRDERLQENARDVGGYLKGRLEELGERHPLIGVVHGSGFYLGPELVRDRVTGEPATTETALICARLRDLGVIAQPTGDHQNILKIKPPMCFTRASADALADALDRVLTTGW
ncbi:aminotransferase [Microbacterium sp. Root180]|uniref:aminotransferase n=1 Tax=Microbacterium sp. Root180 TaxID=1736483 RepID=UPI0006F6F378|nr:aminotransferase [Microbacterium sp. Root180]KRB38994.1 4-aminobutyrate aminotransferase [Microbacterium sp. Root180]